MCLRPLNITEDILCKAQITLGSTAFLLCRQCQTAQLDSLDTSISIDWLDTTRAIRNLVCCVISIKL